MRRIPGAARYYRVSLSRPSLFLASTPASPSPTLGSELLTDPGLEANYTAGLCDTFTKVGSYTTAQSADVHGGSKAQEASNITTVDQSLAYPTVAATSGLWYRAGVWHKRTAGEGVPRLIISQSGGSNFTANLDQAAYAEAVTTLRAINTNNWNLRPMYALGGMAATTVVIDDGSLKAFDTPSLLSGATDLGRRNALYDLPVTVPAGYHGGFMVCLDDETNPANYLLVSINRTKLTLVKCEAGTQTTLIDTATGVTYSDARRIRLVILGTSVAAYYESSAGVFTAIGTVQTVANIASYGTKVAAFGTDATVTFGAWNVRA